MKHNGWLKHDEVLMDGVELNCNKSRVFLRGCIEAKSLPVEQSVALEIASHNVA